MSAVELPKQRRGFSLLSFLIGLVLGGGIASGIFTYLLIDLQAQHALALQQEAVGLLDKGVHIAHDLSGQGAGVKTKAGATALEEQITEIGKAFVEDLERHRLLKVYRSTTEAFQKKMPEPMFMALVEKYPTLRQMDTIQSTREYRVRKLPQDKGYEFYFTGQERNMFPVQYVNIALTLEKAGDEWLIGDLQVARSAKE